MYRVKTELEAEVKLNDNRIVRVKISIEKGELIISVFNRVEEKIKVRKDNIIETTKADKKHHGLGIESVKRTVAQHSGRFVLGGDDKWFQATAIIPQNNRSDASNFVNRNILSNS